jgi:hypothetical protein
MKKVNKKELTVFSAILIPWLPLALNFTLSSHGISLQGVNDWWIGQILIFAPIFALIALGFYWKKNGKAVLLSIFLANTFVYLISVIDEYVHVVGGGYINEPWAHFPGIFIVLALLIFVPIVLTGFFYFGTFLGKNYSAM